jgi:hypothetical protein
MAAVVATAGMPGMTIAIATIVTTAAWRIVITTTIMGAGSRPVLKIADC